MSALKNIITSVTLLSVQHAKTFLLLLAAITLVFCSELPKLSFDSSADSFLSKTDPQRLAYLDFENQFGMSAYFIVLIQDQKLFSSTTIEKIKKLEQAIIDNVPNVAHVESLASATSISADGEQIVIDQFFPDNAPAFDPEIKKEAAIHNPYYLNRLINEQGDTSAIIIKLNRYAVAENEIAPHRVNMTDVSSTLTGLKRVVAEHDNFTVPLLIGGSPTITAELTQSTREDMRIFSLLAITIVAVALFTMFRTLASVCLPLISMVVTIIIVFAVMSFFKFPIQVTGAILPSFLLAVCVGDSVHFLKPFYQSLRSQSIHEAITHAIQHAGVAMFFTTLTTSLGLLSFSFSNIAPVSSFGIFAAAGVWVAFILTITCLPCMLSLLPVKSTKHHPQAEKKAIPLLAAFVDFTTFHHRKILALALLLLAAATYFASQLQFSYNPVSWFDNDNPVKIASTRIEEKLTGTMQIELLIRSVEPLSRSLTPDELRAIDDWLFSLQQRSKQAQESNFVPISSIMSILQLLKQSNEVLLPESGYQLPDSKSLLAQQFLLLQFDGENTVSSLADDQLSMLRVSISVPWQDSLAYNRFIHRLQSDFNQTLGDRLSLEITGMATVANNAFGKMIQSMSLSYLYALVVILIIMLFLFRNVRLGMWLIIPNTLPVLLVLAFMQLCGYPLDLFTMLIGSIAIGIVVDDTIHLVYSFQNYYDEGMPVKQALTKSLHTTGAALTITTIVLCLGFLVYGFSALSNLVAFGYLTALTLCLALIADFIIVPAILYKMYHK